jgi:uncharacterized protein YndB with AHSA1/START domain
MTDTVIRSVEHATFVLERTYPTTRERVFAAMATKEQKAKWFGGGDNPDATWDFDFREGGHELQSGNFTMPDGSTHHATFDAYYLDIVENERVTWSYNMYADGQKLSSSLTVVELTAVPEGTKLTFTETGAFFDGHEKPELREQGSGWNLDALGESLKKPVAE